MCISKLHHTSYASLCYLVKYYNCHLSVSIWWRYGHWQLKVFMMVWTSRDNFPRSWSSFVVCMLNASISRVTCIFKMHYIYLYIIKGTLNNMNLHAWQVGLPGPSAQLWLCLMSIPYWYGYQQYELQNLVWTIGRWSHSIVGFFLKQQVWKVAYCGPGRECTQQL